MSSEDESSVVQRLELRRRIKQVVKWIGSRFMMLVVFFLVCVVGVYLIYPRAYYALTYGVGEDHVILEKRPITCDYDTAPVGKKGCRFEKEVDAMWDITGKTTDVYVVWTRVEETSNPSK